MTIEKTSLMKIASTDARQTRSRWISVGVNFSFLIPIIIFIYTAYLQATINAAETTWRKSHISPTPLSLSLSANILHLSVLGITVLGIFGAVFEKKVWLKVYLVLTGLLAIAQIGVLVHGYTQLPEIVGLEAQRQWTWAFKDHPSWIMQMERKYNCVGWESQDDMGLVMDSKPIVVSNVVSDIEIVMEIVKETGDANISKKRIAEGCKKRMLPQLVDKEQSFALMHLIIRGVQIFGISAFATSLFLYWKMEKQHDDEEENEDGYIGSIEQLEDGTCRCSCKNRNDEPLPPYSEQV